MKCVHCGCERTFRKNSKDLQSVGTFCDNCARMIKIEPKEKPPAVTDGSEEK